MEIAVPGDGLSMPLSASSDLVLARMANGQLHENVGRLAMDHFYKFII